MSALGQKQTLRHNPARSALPPIADMWGRAVTFAAAGPHLSASESVSVATIWFADSVLNCVIPRTTVPGAVATSVAIWATIRLADSVLYGIAGWTRAAAAVVTSTITRTAHRCTSIAVPVEPTAAAVPGDSQVCSDCQPKQRHNGHCQSIHRPCPQLANDKNILSSRCYNSKCVFCHTIGQPGGTSAPSAALYRLASETNPLDNSAFRIINF